VNTLFPMKKNLIQIGLCGVVLALACGCAAPGAPLPPSLRLPVAVDNLAAARKGSRVVLTWSPPDETTDREAIRWPTETRICRVANRYPIAECGEAVASIPGTELASTQPASRVPEVAFEDVLPESMLVSARSAPSNAALWSNVTYAIEVLNHRGRSAGLSNQLRISLLAAEPPPSSLRASVDDRGPRLQWEMASAPPVAAGLSCVVRIYRRLADPAVPGGGEYVPVAEEPCRAGEGEGRDGTFDWEHEYDYKAATVLMLDEAGHVPVEVEGDDSNRIHLLVHDSFPPAVPSGLQAVFSGVGQEPFVDLTWVPQTESDLAGYIVYRRSDGGDFTVVSPEPVPISAWRDLGVQPGVTYEYAVAAVDQRGNQSALSDPASEQVPAAEPAPQEGM
jgi:hypothetical protein